MSGEAKVGGALHPAAKVESYDRVLKTLHWASLLFVAAAFSAVWASHIATSREQSAILLVLHRSLGVTILALTLGRLAWRWHARIPALPAGLPALQKIAARLTEYCLYLLLLLQPILGVLHTNARGRRVELYFIAELPPVVAPDKVLAKQTMAAHEFVGYILLALIALHAAAALFHHFVLGDNVLRAMLPRPARRPGAADAMRLAPQGEDF